MGAGLQSVSAAPAGEGGEPEGVYLGYYQEDPVTNPEDPTLGAVYLRLPKGDSSFAGKMYFTYVGCQSSNVGSIQGNKTDTALKGDWTGTLDGTSQKGSFTGVLAAPGNYSGTYTVFGGKQHIDIPNCINYYIAPKGTFALFSVEQNQPQNFSVAARGDSVTWSSPPGAQMTLVFLLDLAKVAESANNATVWQTLVLGPRNQATLDRTRLAPGHHYVIAVAAVNSRFERVAFGSVRYSAP
jgi:hypothetical protein